MSELYINIGTNKCCFFTNVSLFLIHKLRRQPLLYFAIEESLECAKIGYYGIGIIAFSQLLNLLKEKTPDARHDVAHEFLTQRPTEAIFKGIVEDFKHAASKMCDSERARTDDIPKYTRRVTEEWGTLMKELHGENWAV